MKITAEPRSDQWNADDFIGGPRTFTIANVKPGAAEQKYDIELVEGEGRVWRPPVTVLRLLIAAWDDETEVWKGRRVQLYRDPTITFGRDQVGGIRIKALSHIDKPITERLTVTRGKRGQFTIQPLTAAVTPAQVAASTDIEQLRAWWHGADETTRDAITKRVDALKADAAPVTEGNPWEEGK